MLTVLLYQLPGLVGLLRSASLHNRRLTVVSASSPDELVRCAEAGQPNVVIVSAAHAEIDRQLLMRMRSVVRQRPSLFFLCGDHAATFAYAGVDDYDGVLTLEDPESRFTRIHLPGTTPGTRRDPRMPVQIPVEIVHGARAAIAGSAIDLSRTGAALRVERLPDGPGPHRVRFHRSDGRSASLMVRTIWAASKSPSFVLGVRFLDARHDVGTALNDLALWEIVDESDGPVIYLQGEISEETPLWRLATQISCTSRVDFSRIGRIDFVGIYRLAELFGSLPASPPLRLRRVPTLLLRQRRLAELMTANCILESYYAGFDCTRCNIGVPVLCTGVDSAPATCPLCNGPLEAVAIDGLRLPANAVTTH